MKVGCCSCCLPYAASSMMLKKLYNFAWDTAVASVAYDVNVAAEVEDIEVYRRC